MNPSEMTKQTLDLVKSLSPDGNVLRKAGISQSLGLVGYSLEAPAKLIYPVLTPLRNSIPRVGPGPNGISGTAEHWKAITSINSTNVRAGVSEGNRNAAISFTEVDRTVAYAGLGMEDFVTFEADYAGRGFEDVKADAVLMNLQSLMIAEEQIILNGNATLALGTTPTPTLVASTTGGTVASGTTNFVYCAALTWAGFTFNGGAQNPAGGSAVLIPIVSRTNVDASSDTFGGGVARISAASSALTTTGATSSISATVAPVKGAFGYAWFFGVSAGAANAFLVAVTSLPTVVITAPATSTYAANATGLSADNSTCGLEFDGLITSTLSTSGYYKSMAGGTLTADGYGGVVEIDAMLKYFWDNFKSSPDNLYVDSQCARDITKKILAGTTNPTYRINLQNSLESLGNVMGGSLVVEYLNKYSLNGARPLMIRLHPYMPTGTIFADMATNPYPNSRIPVPRRIRTRQEYYQLEWPVRTRKYEYGVYVDEMLQMYMGFGNGVITDIAAG